MAMACRTMPRLCSIRQLLAIPQSPAVCEDFSNTARHGYETASRGRSEEWRDRTAVRGHGARP